MIAPLPRCTVAVGWKTVRVAAALVAAWAALESQKMAAATIRRMTTRAMTRRNPPRRFGAVRAAVTDMAGTIPKGMPKLDSSGSIRAPPASRDWPGSPRHDFVLPVTFDNHRVAAWAFARIH